MERLRELTKSNKNAGPIIESAIWAIGIILVWQLFTQAFQIPSHLLPSPSAIIQRTITFADLPRHVLATLYGVLEGFSVAAIVGITLATLIAHSQRLARGLYPLLSMSDAIPKAALAPLFVIWIGFGALPRLLITFLTAFFPIVVNTLSGLTIIEPEMLDMMSSLKATKWQVFRKIRLPTSMPYIFTAFKISAPLSVIGAVNAEFFSGNEGLGYLVLESNWRVDIPLLFSALVCMAAIGLGLFAVVLVTERLLLPWYKK